MVFSSERMTISTQGECDVVDITAEVQKRVEAFGKRRGLATIFVAGATAGITTLEYEPGLVEDLKQAVERLLPSGTEYEHDKRWRDANGHSHLRAALLGPSLVVPIAEGRLTLGTWQQIVVVDFDNRARTRAVHLQLMGE